MNDANAVKELKHPGRGGSEYAPIRHLTYPLGPMANECEEW